MGKIKIKVSNQLGKFKMSQRDLARETGIRPATIHTYYHETVQRIDVEHLAKMCEVFKCQPGDLLEYIPGEE